jgi:hypothetical protein
MIAKASNNEKHVNKDRGKKKNRTAMTTYERAKDRRDGGGSKIQNPRQTITTGEGVYYSGG